LDGKFRWETIVNSTTDYCALLHFPFRFNIFLFCLTRFGRLHSRECSRSFMRRPLLQYELAVVLSRIFCQLCLSACCSLICQMVYIDPYTVSRQSTNCSLFIRSTILNCRCRTGLLDQRGTQFVFFLVFWFLFLVLSSSLQISGRYKTAF